MRSSLFPTVIFPREIGISLNYYGTPFSEAAVDSDCRFSSGTGPTSRPSVSRPRAGVARLGKIAQRSTQDRGSASHLDRQDP